MTSDRTAGNRLSSPTLVYNSSSLLRMCALLRRQSLVALDTESDSLYSYYSKVCLIQISTYAESERPDPNRVLDFLVDPLRLETLEPLGVLFADPTVEVIVHAAENDILTLQRDFRFSFVNIFDTQLAARILGWKQVGLANILEERFGLISDKRMQRTNWGLRPLSPQQIAYAQMDTHYLPALRLLQIAELKAKGRWEEAQEAFAVLARLDYRERTPNHRSFWQMKGTRSVPRQATGVLEALWDWREREAQRQNRPPFKVAGDHTLIDLTLAQPATLEALHDVPGLSAFQIERYGHALLEAVRSGRLRPLPRLPDPTSRPEDDLDNLALARYEVLRHWRSKEAKRRDVGPDIIFTNSVLMEIARRAPHTVDDLLAIEEIGPWKAKTYAPTIFKVLESVRG